MPGTRQHEPQPGPTTVRGPYTNTVGQILLGEHPTPPPPSKRPEKHGSPHLLGTRKETENRFLEVLRRSNYLTVQRKGYGCHLSGLT